MRDIQAGQSTEQLRALPRPRVLVAEDEDTIRMIVMDVLQAAGYEVEGASNGRDALTEFHNGKQSIILTDIMMPGMSGLELLEAVRAADRDAEVIVMTSNGTMESALRALRAGAYDFLEKPFESLDLIVSTVNRACEKVQLRLWTRQLTDDLLTRTEELDHANTALRRLADTLKDQADQDGLTGLQNHRAFREALIREIGVAERSGDVFSLVFMDVDHFKKFNDTYGHLAGDAVLRQLADLVRATVPNDAFLARYGGEEIVALIPKMPKHEATRLAETVRTAVESNVFTSPESESLGAVTLSLGVAGYPEDGREPADVIKSADQAVYAAKNQGRNAVVA